MSSRLRSEINEQRAANESALPYADLYQSHRKNLTDQILRVQQVQKGASLCVLGAGNCFDLDLDALMARFERVHLVDLDQAALEGVQGRLPAVQRQQLSCHAPVDLSGMLSKLEPWSRFAVTAGDLVEHPAQTAKQLLAELGGPFDVVVSACVMTQMQLSILKVLTDSHRLFSAVRHTLTVTHLRTLAALTAEGGCALLATDLVASDHLALPANASPEILKGAFHEAVSGGNVIYVSHPGVIEAAIKDDPVLRRQLECTEIDAVWLWQQGPKRTFMVYAMDLMRRSAA